MNRILEPNCYCKNRYCPHGEGGQPKRFYACKYCSRVASYKSVACCPECFQAYQDQVLRERERTRKLNNRIDMNDEQFATLMATSIVQVAEDSINEIKDAGYGDVLQDEGFAAAVDKINEDIKAAEAVAVEKPKKKRTRKPKVVEVETPEVVPQE